MREVKADYNPAIMKEVNRKVYLAPFYYRDDADKTLYFQWIDGDYIVMDRDGVKFWRDKVDDKRYLQSISTIADR